MLNGSEEGNDNAYMPERTLFYGFGKAVSMQVDRQVTDVYAWSTMTVISGQYVTKNNTKRIKHN